MVRKGQHPNRFRALLRKAGLTVREVHRETAIPESTLYYWAAGNGVIPKEDRVVLARLIGCFPRDLAPIYDMLESRYGNISSEWEGEKRIMIEEWEWKMPIPKIPLSSVELDVEEAVYLQKHSKAVTMSSILLFSLAMSSTSCRSRLL